MRVPFNYDDIYPDQPEGEPEEGPEGEPEGLSTQLYVKPEMLDRWSVPNYLSKTPEKPCKTYTETLKKGYPPFSQIGQDVVLYHLFNGFSDGKFFVDLAAAFPKYLSNTYYMEKCMGWDGVCIEGDHRKKDALVKQRTCQVVDKCVSVQVEEITVSLRGYLSGTDKFETGYTGRGTKKVTCVGIDSILDDVEAPKTIDFMSLDIEGAEAKAIKSVGDYKIEVSLIQLDKIRQDNVTSEVILDYLESNSFVPDFGFKTKFRKIPDICDIRVDMFDTKDMFDKKWVRQHKRNAADILFYRANGKYQDRIKEIISNCNI